VDSAVAIAAHSEEFALARNIISIFTVSNGVYFNYRSQIAPDLLWRKSLDLCDRLAAFHTGGMVTY